MNSFCSHGWQTRVRSELASYPISTPVLSLFLAIAWLLPNHYPPWSTFHNDAWTAGALLVIAAWLLATRIQTVSVSIPAAFILVLSLYAAFHDGMEVFLPSNALMNGMYVFGLAIAFALGQNWAQKESGKPLDILLGAALVASIASVGMQLYQWLGYAHDPELEEIWIAQMAMGGRPYANLAQPNQLASLLLWGLLGASWLWHKRKIGDAIGLLLSGFLLFGVALTESRTAMVSLMLAFVVASFGWFQGISARTRRRTQLLVIFYFFCIFALQPLGRILDLPVTPTVFERTSGAMRLSIWSATVDAISLHPWTGYGWNRANAGLLEVFPSYPIFTNLYFAQSHNLALDLALWIGLPLAFFTCAAVAWWFLGLIGRSASVPQLVALSAIAAMGIHAMLELPLHYGYFLWPTGVLAGAASANWPAKPLFRMPLRIAATVIAGLVLLLAVVVRDYLAIEEAMVELRFELLKIGSGHRQQPPDTILLGDWASFIRMTRTAPTADMPDTQIAEWKALLLYNTSPMPFKRLTQALSLKGRDAEANYWAERACVVLPRKACQPLIDDPGQTRSSQSQTPFDGDR